MRRDLKKRSNILICSLILGRRGSVGFPGKNLYEINGRPLAWYPMTAAKKCDLIDRHFISTDDPTLMELGKSVGFEIIERPPELATPEALGEDAYIHGFQEICRRLGKEPDMLVLLFCNAPTVNKNLIISGIQSLTNDPEASSAVTVSKYNMYSPVRARRINLQGYLDPFIPFEQHPHESTINCDRDSQGDVWFADVALVVIRSSKVTR